VATIPSAGRATKPDSVSARPLASLKTPLDTAIGLLARGLWPVLIYPKGATLPGGGIATGKEPIGKAWGAERWDVDKLKRTHRRYPEAGAGLGQGPGRGPGGKWLIDAEGDGPEAEASRAVLFGGEDVPTLGWSSTRGGHQLLTVDGDRLLPILARLKGFETKAPGQPGVYNLPSLPGLELRIGGYKPNGEVKQLQSVVPPTKGTDSTPRRWGPVEPIAEAPESFYAALERFADEAREPAPEAKPVAPDRGPPRNQGAKNGRESGGWEVRPGDAFAAAVTWDELLKGWGWTRTHSEGQTAYWRRPDKADGHSATVNHDGGDCLYVFTTSTPLKADESYTKFGAYVAMEHGGDFTRATRALFAKGFGVEKPKPDRTGRGRAEPSTNGHPSGPKPSDPEARRPEGEGWRLDVISASSIKIRPVKYLAKPYLPRSMMITMAGLGGEGKTQLIIDCLARLSTGRPCLGLERADVGPIDCLLLACEDGREDTLGPRLIAAGADMGRVDIVRGMVNTKTERVPFDISYLPYLRRHIDEGREQGKDYQLVAIDPITTYVGRAKIDDHRDAQLKPALEGLSAISQDLGITFICSAHLNKGGNGKGAIYRILGGTAYVTTSRLVYVLGRDPDDDTRRILASPKCNLPIWPPSVAVRVESFEPAEAQAILAGHVEHLDEADRSELAEQLRRLKYEGTVKLSADEILDSGGGKKEAPDHVQGAAEWLQDRLADGPAGSNLVAMQGDGYLKRPWPNGSMDPERRRIAVAGRVKWWRETVLKAQLGGSSRKDGRSGLWFFTLPNQDWPPSEADIRAAGDVETEAEEGKKPF
jgi:hypothetical protein